MDKKKITHPLSKLVNPEIPLLEKLEWFGIKPGLERINWLLNLLDNPEKKFLSIIVGGTNGKGSVSTILYSILVHNGYNAGLYTSPHLVSICERFRSAEGIISQEEFRSIVQKITNKVSEEELIKMGITYFEFTTAMAFKWFAEKKVDIAVLEVGMGGRLDATNSAPAILSIITSVSRDHTKYLGGKIDDIAFEKAGIIKRNAPCLTACTGTALKVIQEQAIKKNAPLYIYGRDFYTIKKYNHSFDYHGIKKVLKNLRLNLNGDHQLTNAALALAAQEILENRGLVFSLERTESALKNSTVYGRFELLREKPAVLLDGAHNPSAIKVFVKTLLVTFPHKRYHIIFGAMKDKDIKGMIKILETISRDFYLPSINIERAEKPDNIREFLRKDISALCFKNIEDAYFSALNRAGKNDVICITGSFYLLGEFLRTLK